MTGASLAARIEVGFLVGGVATIVAFLVGLNVICAEVDDPFYGWLYRWVDRPLWWRALARAKAARATRRLRNNPPARFRPCSECHRPTSNVLYDGSGRGFAQPCGHELMPEA